MTSNFKETFLFLTKLMWKNRYVDDAGKAVTVVS